MGDMDKIDRINRILEAAMALAQGEYNTTIERSPANDEIDAIAYCFNQMIDDLRWTQDALKQSEQRFRSLAERLPLIIYETDVNGNFRYTNPMGERLTGYTQADIARGLHMLDLLIPADHKRARVNILAATTGNITPGTRYTIVRKDGNTFPAEIHSSPHIINGELAGLCGYAIDLTERTKVEKENADLQKQIMLSAKLASVGELAAGVAHEINNPAAIISLTREAMSELISADTIDRQKIKAALAKQANSIKRIVTIVKGLSVYAHPEQLTEKSSILIHNVIEDTVDLVASMYQKENISIELNFNCIMPKVLGNPGKFQQVIMNLLSNARDALIEKKGGQIAIRTEQQADHLIIRVADSGCGINKNNLEQIFDPFYTTKAPGQGTGLGLAIAHNIITKMQGQLRVESETGLGTTFTITVPVAAKIARVEEEKATAVVALSGKVLVVDDELDICDVLHVMLARTGLAVTTATSGNAALEKLRQHHYDYLVTDLKMPEMSGEELVRQAEYNGLIAKTKVVVMTGATLPEYTPAQIQFIRDKAVALIHKPFSMELIYQTLKEIQQS